MTGTVLWSSERAVHTLKCFAVSPAPIKKKKKIICSARLLLPSQELFTPRARPACFSLPKSRPKCSHYHSRDPWRGRQRATRIHDRCLSCPLAWHLCLGGDDKMTQGAGRRKSISRLTLPCTSWRDPLSTTSEFCLSGGYLEILDNALYSSFFNLS